MGQFNCLICFHEQHGPVYQVKEMMFGLAEAFPYVQCARCGTIQQLNPPADMAPYYPEGYYSLSGLSLSGLQVRWMKQFRFWLYQNTGFSLFKPIYGEWLKRLDAKRGDAIGDIGCGNGQLLYELYASGYRNLTGYDPFIDADLYPGTGLQIFKKSLFDIQGSFDVLMLHHAFEHMNSPDTAFAKVAALLNPSGRLLIRVPVSDGEAWTVFREDWVQLDAPRHYFIPSLAAMKILAQRHGLDLFHVDFDSTAFQFWGSRKYQQGQALYETKDRPQSAAKDTWQLERKARELNAVSKGDQAAFYFRKSQD
ncbi:Methyltransferase domain-containing protein [Cyclobacterium lianum]|uniref:Methyltransferase domain-containing protein n=1 Tax=Cyclobacterium lianum TaxID=388280 RepID=A0A1M7JUE6_9BACT|nr:class I SAM-dependent methyltransferase [Cyclobacterium lianum]SHM56659.1 Methyltransferase domain-containing protein [Cyclobacterium lianum]